MTKAQIAEVAVLFFFSDRRYCRKESCNFFGVNSKPIRMKKTALLKFAVAALVGAAVVVSCQKSVDEMEGSDSVGSLKSAADVKVSYIVTLNDADLNAELAAVAAYSAKKDKVAATAAKLL